MKSLSIITAFIGGAAVGAAIGLLFAPAKGAETRSYVSDFLSKHGINLSNSEVDLIASEFEDKIKREKV